MSRLWDYLKSTVTGLLVFAAVFAAFALIAATSPWSLLLIFAVLIVAAAWSVGASIRKDWHLWP